MFSFSSQKKWWSVTFLYRPPRTTHNFVPLFLTAQWELQSYFSSKFFCFSPSFLIKYYSNIILLIFQNFLLVMRMPAVQFLSNTNRWLASFEVIFILKRFQLKRKSSGLQLIFIQMMVECLWCLITGKWFLPALQPRINPVITSTQTNHRVSN